jgi:Arf-GAP/SH3 domain/ANK repeat/PH domain-containing protein
VFSFTFVQRQAVDSAAGTGVDTAINGLTFLFAPTAKELDNLITKELQADPNFHKTNPNVQFIGDYNTGGSPSVQFQWTWKWKPPRVSEDRGGGWRNCCSVCCEVAFTDMANYMGSLSNTTKEITS